MATVLVIGTLDTKGPESRYLKERIEALGVRTLVLDSGILGEADGIVPDYPRQDVAKAAGHTIDELRNAGSRGKAVERMLIGVRKIALDLFAKKEIHGVVALGGAEGSVLATAAMKALPLGIPKLVVSPIASGRRHFGPFVGTRDVLVMHSVVDILGLNSVSTSVFDNAAAAISGMARSYESQAGQPTKVVKKQIAATMLGNTTRPLMSIKKQLEPRGFDLVIFHANGVGGPAMEELIDDGHFKGVIDYTLSELAGQEAGGFHVGGENRLAAAGNAGIPQVVVPGCVDFIVFGPKDEVPEKFRGRPSYYHNPEFTLVRVSGDEQLRIARRMAAKLNPSKGRVSVLIPLRGLSIPNHEKGGEFWDPVADAAFRKELKSALNPEIEVREIDAHINDESFATAVLDKANELFK
ncbi:MAG TPA: Tm-1-like ATP-binding domain-containing protein [Planctomycetota bacterium]|nr:Tm-1-like ATP-binding domain-containing protein [Planctomycetota bacterium]